jgi:N-acetylglutamate synthase-like GNAT family acetyltransferase
MNRMSMLTLNRDDERAARRVAPDAVTRSRTRPRSTPRRPGRAIGRAIIRGATAADAPAIHRLITKHASEGHLLPRMLSELTERADRFLVATVRGRIVGCAELAPLGPSVAEVRSFVVSTLARGLGLGRSLIDELRGRARSQGFDQLCAFTHAPAYFARLDFAIVLHASVPEKIAADCCRCSLFGTCGQYALVTDLAPSASTACGSTSFLPMA